MARFFYTGRNSSTGKAEKGYMEAESETSVATQLIEQSITPVTIKLIKPKFNIWKFEITPKKVKTSDLVMLCRQMYSLTKAGVPIISSLEHLQSSFKEGPIKTALQQIAVDVSAGKSLADAMSAHPRVFSNIFVNLVEAGENSGKLDQAFEEAARYLEFEEQTRKRIKSVTRYPTFVIIALVIAFCVINFFVIPAFQMLYAQFKTELPLLTRVLIATSDFLLAYWPYCLGGLILLYILIRYYLKSEKGRMQWDHMKLNLPIFGKIIRQTMMARFSRILAMMLSSGVPITKSLRLVGKTSGNEYLAHHVMNMAEEVESGRLLSEAAKKTNLFTPLTLQMMSVGEESGSVESLLLEVAGFYEREVDYDLSRLSDLIEPILLVIMGGLVLIFALGVFLPIWNLVAVAQR